MVGNPWAFHIAPLLFFPPNGKERHHAKVRVPTGAQLPEAWPKDGDGGPPHPVEAEADTQEVLA